MNIPQHIIDELIEQAERDAPIESCGYLMGTGDNVSENYPMENVDHSAEHFSFAPRQQFASRPSQEDLRLAQDPSIRYAILSLLGGEPRLNSFRIVRGEVVDRQEHL